MGSIFRTHASVQLDACMQCAGEARHNSSCRAWQSYWLVVLPALQLARCSSQASRCGLPSCSMPPVSSGCSQLHQQVLCSTGHHTVRSLGSEDTASTPPGAP